MQLIWFNLFNRILVDPERGPTWDTTLLPDKGTGSGRQRLLLEIEMLETLSRQLGQVGAFA